MITKTEGIVLKYTNLGEADKILTLLTRNKGKVKAIAKGCRKPKSSLLASSEVFTFSEYVLYRRSNLYHITQAETRETFYPIRKDLLKLSYAAYLVELADTVSDEDIPSERLFLLLAKALYYLSLGEIPIGVLCLAYELKLMDISGYRPNLARCVCCHEDKESYSGFSIDLGGVVCNDCYRFEKNVYKLSPGTLEAFKFLLNTEISRVNIVKMDNTIFSEMDRIIKLFIENHLDKKFKSLEFLDSIKNYERS